MTPVNSPINTVEAIFWLLALSYVILGLLINVLHSFLPPFVRRVLFYGKISGDEPTRGGLAALLLVPKAWFRHFYLFAAIWSSLVVLVTGEGLASGRVSARFIGFLDSVCGSQRTVQTTSLETCAALILMYIHILVRLFETHFTQVFSKKATMNLIQYFTSFVYYFGVIALLLCRGQGFVSGSSIELRLQDFSWRLLICFLVFAFASYHQFRSHGILANLRRNRSGKVTSEGHFLPTGGFFEMVSSPHMLFECLIYLAIFGIVCRNSSWLAVLALVAANQVTMAYETHLWYCKNFPNYPPRRAALIPYLL
ncbi:polyprenol reductase-like [Phlebotomus argentipes]|uniref:polyprenol reductase-like n=1 Tax=Phlebotomus argentipes TaxID=94469 RepID=UPI00289321F2|nr:polyprenol reductase-like [Phlebotomus argentipes]